MTPLNAQVSYHVWLQVWTDVFEQVPGQIRGQISNILGDEIKSELHGHPFYRIVHHIKDATLTFD